MLPNLKIVIGGILAFVLLLAVTGAGIVTAPTYTRIGTTPEVSHPMMQRIFAEDVSAPALGAAVLARREAELDSLRELAPSTGGADSPTDEDDVDATGTVKSPDPAIAAAINGVPGDATRDGKPFGRDTNRPPNPADAGPAQQSPALSGVAVASAAESAAQPAAASPGDAIAATTAPESTKAVIPEASRNAEQPPAPRHHHGAALASKKALKVAARPRKSRFHKAPQPGQETTQSTAYNPFGQSLQPSCQSYYQPTPSLRSAANPNLVSRRAQ
jgi:hypothetical protein